MLYQPLMAFAIFLSLLVPHAIHAEEVSDPPSSVVPAAEEKVVSQSVLIREKLEFSDVAKPSVLFWNELAQCETAQDWQNGGSFAGGLGIYTRGRFGASNMGTWERWGGEEFAPSPDKATKEEQIIVANRIAFEGYRKVVKRDPHKAKRMGVPDVYVWEREPVGLTGWGCYKSKSTGKYRMAKPRRYHADRPSLVPLAKFYMGEEGMIVKDLQTFLRITVDGKYGKKTRRAHLRWLAKRGLPTDGVPPLPPRHQS